MCCDCYVGAVFAEFWFVRYCSIPSPGVLILVAAAHATFSFSRGKGQGVGPNMRYFMIFHTSLAGGGLGVPRGPLTHDPPIHLKQSSCLLQ